MLGVGIFALGLITGLALKGINITITHKREEAPKKEGYNPSMAGLLPNEVQKYYQDTNGFNKF